MYNIKKIVLTLTMLGFIALISCQKGGRNASPIVATAGNATLHLDEVREMLPKDPSVLISAAQVQNLVQRWAEEELVYQYAVEQKYDKNPEVRAKVQNLIKNYIAASFLGQEIGSHLTVTKEEVQQYYDANKNEFLRPDNYYHIKLLLVGSYAQANKARQQILSGASFDSLVAKLSLEATKLQNGDKGWVTLEQIPSELARQVRTMASGSISRPIKTKVGYYLVQLLGVRKKDETQTLEEVEALITFRIKARKREQAYGQLINQLKETSGMNVNWSFIDSLNVVQ